MMQMGHQEAAQSRPQWSDFKRHIHLDPGRTQMFVVVSDKSSRCSFFAKEFYEVATCTLSKDQIHEQMVDLLRSTANPGGMIC